MPHEKSIYSLNKNDINAIVYTDADGKILRLTREDFSSEEEFMKWKSWSDADLHAQDNAETVYSKHKAVLLENTVVTLSAEETIISHLNRRERIKIAEESLMAVRGQITEKQFRRIRMYCSGMTVREIGKVEGVAFQNIFKSIQAGKKKILKNLRKQGDK